MALVWLFVALYERLKPMAAIQNQHQQLTTLLAQAQWDEAQNLWLELASQLSDQPGFLLLLVKEFADAGRADTAAEFAGLLAPSLKNSGNPHEWFFALKLQTSAKYPADGLRQELAAAYQQIHQADPRLPTILNLAGFDEPRTHLSTAITKADTLLALATGAYCQHKSWGFGRVKAFDTALNRIVVSFPHNPDHAMQLAYAAESLTPVSPDHIEVRKATDLAGLKQLAETDPLAVLRIVLMSFNRAATAIQIENCLVENVFTAAQWKKWWDNTRKLAKRDPHFEVPGKKTDPFRLHTAPVSQQDELLQAFRDALGLSQKVEICRQLLKLTGELEDPDLLLQEFYDGLQTAITKTSGTKPADRLEAAFLLDELLAAQSHPTETTAPLVAQILDAAPNLPALLDSLSASAQKRALAHIQRTQPDRLRQILNHLDARALDEITDSLAADAVRIIQLVQNQTASRELLLWLCRAVTSARPPAWLDALPRPALLAAVLNAIESADNRTASKRLRDQMLGDDTLITELLADATPAVIRDHARQLLASTAFEELDRRLLLARLVKEFPFVQDLLVTKTIKEQPLIVSRASFEKRRAELEEIVQKKIPQNSKEIGVARSYGDLRENFEFKAAKDMQRLLMRQRAELEVMLTRATPTDFSDAKTDTVQPGTTVTVTDLATNKPVTYHILGAWDGDPARNIISYPAALAQAFLNKKPGDTTEAQGESGKVRLRIDRVEKVPAEILQAL